MTTRGKRPGHCLHGIVCNLQLNAHLLPDSVTYESNHGIVQPHDKAMKSL
jgi:hypothetical protein